MPQDEKKIWFPAKTYGLGWGPPTCWQGWLVIGGYLFLLMAGGLVFLSPKPNLACFIAWDLFWTVGLIIVCWTKGPPLKWRWGKRD